MKFELFSAGTGVGCLQLRGGLLGRRRGGTCLADARRQQERRGGGGRRGGHGCSRHRLIGAHRGGGLDPHPGVVGLVERDRNRVDAKEVGGDQHGVHRVVERQLGQRRHDRQRRGVGGRGGLVLHRGCRAVRAGLRQPRQVRRVGGDVLLGARALPRPRLNRAQQAGEFGCRGRVFKATATAMPLRRPASTRGRGRYSAAPSAPRVAWPSRLGRSRLSCPRSGTTRRPRRRRWRS